MDDDQSNSFLHDGDIELIKKIKLFLYFLHNLEEKIFFIIENIFGLKFFAKSQNFDLRENWLVQFCTVQFCKYAVTFANELRITKTAIWFKLAFIWHFTKAHRDPDANTLWCAVGRIYSRKFGI